MAEIHSTIPFSVAIDLRVVPVREIGSTLVLATDSKTGIEAQNRIEYLLNRDVRFVFRNRQWIESELDAHYRSTEEFDEVETEYDSISWYWPSWHHLNGDKLVVKASGWDGSTHWSGAYEFPADHPDRAFWNWLITIPMYANGLLDDREIPKVKRIWIRYQHRTLQGTNNPMNPSGGLDAS